MLPQAVDPSDTCTETLPIQKNPTKTHKNPTSQHIYKTRWETWPCLWSTVISEASLFSFTTDFFVRKPSHQPTMTLCLCRTSHSSGLLVAGLDNMETNTYHKFWETSPALVHIRTTGSKTLKAQSTPSCLQFTLPVDRSQLPDNLAA